MAAERRREISPRTATALPFGGSTAAKRAPFAQKIEFPLLLGRSGTPSILNLLVPRICASLVQPTASDIFPNHAYASRWARATVRGSRLCAGLAKRRHAVSFTRGGGGASGIRSSHFFTNANYAAAAVFRLLAQNFSEFVGF